MATMYETKGIIVASLGKNTEYVVKKVYRGINSMIFLSTTRKMIARRSKIYNKLIKIQTE